MNEVKSTVNVFDSTLLQLDEIFNTFDNVCVYLSGGENSTVLLHLTATVAKVHQKKFSVLFIDREAQHAFTINHISKMKKKYSDVINTFYWIALPLTTINERGASQPEWLSWEEGLEWWRAPPAEAITDNDFFPFYYYAMSTEDFIAAFSPWLASEKKLASLVGTRDDVLFSQQISFPLKSLSPPHHHVEDASSEELKHDFIYPLYGWQAKDIWLFNNLSKSLYNPLYDLAYRSGTAFKDIKIREPFESNSWQITNELSPVSLPREVGANHSTLKSVHEERGIKPESQTWYSYVMFLLNTMPRKTAEYYRVKISNYTDWYQTQGYTESIPDQQNDCLTGKGITSWENICMMIMGNNYRARALSISAPASNRSDIYSNRKKIRKGRGRGNEAMFL